jgi:PEP-CTERM motif./Matrixin.
MKTMKLFTGACMLGFVGQALAYNVFPYGTDQALKWGDNTVGTPGGIVTWGLMTPGVTVDHTDPNLADITGTSDLSAVFAQVGGEAAALTMIQDAFNAWSSVANIQFVQVDETGAVPFDAAYSAVGANVIGNIRIGAFNISGASADVGFAPPPNGGRTLEGDILFNTRSDISYFVAPGNESDSYDLYPPGGGYYQNDFQGIMTHEIGHALGLAHSEVPSALMCGYVSAAFDGSQCAYADPGNTGQAPINRLPDADDIAGIQHLYGPAVAAVPEADTWAMLLAGLGLVGFVAARQRG